MTVVRSEAIMCSVRPHGEHGAIVRLLTEESGLVAGYVRGGRSTRMRPVLIAGNVVQVELRARTAAQLATVTAELVHSRAPLLAEPLPAAAVEWLCGLTAATVPEEEACPVIHSALAGVLDAVEMAPAARGWAVALVQYERLLLAELGFGLDLSACAVTGGQDDLVHVSPTTGRAVSRAGAVGYEGRMLPLPGFLRHGGEADWADILDGLRLTGHFLARNLLTERRADVLAARDRLVERLKRAIA